MKDMDARSAAETQIVVVVVWRVPVAIGNAHVRRFIVETAAAHHAGRFPACPTALLGSIIIICHSIP